MFRWRDRHYFGPRRWLETALRDTWYERDVDGTKKKVYHHDVGIFAFSLLYFANKFDHSSVTIKSGLV